MLRLQPQHPLPRPESLPYLGHGTIRDIPTLLVEPETAEKILLVDFKERDCSHVADEIVHVLNDENFCEQLVCTGREIVVEHFNMKKLCATQRVRIYKEQIKE